MSHVKKNLRKGWMLGFFWWPPTVFFKLDSLVFNIKKEAHSTVGVPLFVDLVFGGPDLLGKRRMVGMWNFARCVGMAPVFLTSPSEC